MGIDYAKVKLAAAEAKVRENEELAIEEFLRATAERRKETAFFSAKLADLGITGEEARRATLVRRLEDAAETGRKVATTSGNLKGTYIKALKEMADGILEASKELGALSQRRSGDWRERQRQPPRRARATQN